MDAYLENYVNAETKKGIIEELFNYSALRTKYSYTAVTEKKAIKPLRGYGRFKPMNIAVEENIVELFLAHLPNSLKGFGRKQSVYSSINQHSTDKEQVESKPESRTYKYWRGIGKSSLW